MGSERRAPSRITAMSHAANASVLVMPIATIHRFPAREPRTGPMAMQAASPTTRLMMRNP
ncbi:hypothetical protein ACFPRL_17335 [Pseudoclavibacter helvolus]